MTPVNESHQSRLKDGSPKSRNVNLVKQQTSVRRNRCNLDELANVRGIQVNKATVFDPDLTIDIIKNHWVIPTLMPDKFPPNYPPTAPLLDTPLPQTVARDLQRAFTQNTVTYAERGVEGNLVFELLGDKYMSFLLARTIQRDLQRYQQESIYRDLDLGGLDFLFRCICCGVQQSFFAMMFNFPARVRLAYKSEPAGGLPVFSQRDMEGTFEAFLAVCFQHVEMGELQIWFEALIEPWMPGAVAGAIRCQHERDGEEGISNTLNTLNKARHSLLERRPGTAEFVGKLPCIVEPKLPVLILVSDSPARNGPTLPHFLASPDGSPSSRASTRSAASAIASSVHVDTSLDGQEERISVEGLEPACKRPRLGSK